MNPQKITALLLVSIVMITSCAKEAPSTNDTVAVEQGKVLPDVPAAATASPGKPSAPVDISYEVMGNPVVGVPVAVNVVITSQHKPLSVRYSIDDKSALAFQSGQVEKLDVPDASAGSQQQLNVIPQREGRVYINVSAEVPSDLGTMIRSVAIPIKVGSAPKKTTINGELKEGPDGEKVISMPAQESN